ncbi:hypothetical protein [Marinobacter sp. SS13-12]|uniref:hypothetical protein n=1 Tax=Marinobacter sp. SS13-12 TaxID=3050451 RepID=UPI0025568DEC|nr:hypothetical protein [Marinobacter sp. SS13-12]MDK8465670.1 hypothetical protein [Marinobacter sp. SS13-12]
MTSMMQDAPLKETLQLAPNNLGSERIYPFVWRLWPVLVQLDQKFQAFERDFLDAKNSMEVSLSEDGFNRISAPKGFMGAYPQHAALLELAQRPKVSGQLTCLVAAIIVTRARWEIVAMSSLPESMTEDEKKAWCHARLCEVWRAIRLLSKACQRKLPPSTNSLAELHDSLEHALASVPDDENFGHERLIPIKNFLATFLQDRKPRSRSSSVTIEQNSDERSIETVFTETGDTGCVDTDGVDFLTTRLSDVEVRGSDHFREGNAPSELTSGPILRRSDKHLQLHKGDSTAAAMMRGRSKSIHCRRSLQLLPGRWGELTPYDLIHLVDALLSSASPVLASAISLIILTGRPLSDVLNARLVQTRSQLPETVESHDLYLIKEEMAWATGVARPESQKRAERSWRSVLRKHASALILPFPRYFWTELFKLPVPNVDGKKRSVALFKGYKPGELEKELKELLRHINKEQRTSLTLHRVENSLFVFLRLVTGDLADAFLITGKQPPWGQSASIYYHSRSITELTKLYQKAIGQTFCLSNFENGWLSSPSTLDDDKVVGSRLSPSAAALQTLVGDLVNRVIADEAAMQSEGGFIRFHNSFTSYCVMMTLFGTGYRAVKDPIEDRRFLKLAPAFPAWPTLLIVDKTTDGYGHGRTVALADILVEQLTAYERHTEIVKSRSLALGLPQASTGFFFYLTEDGRPERLTPTSLSAALSWAYRNLPLNLNRHYLRAGLRRKQIPGPAVDRFMGHWTLGQEPMGRFSGADPIMGVLKLREAANELLSETGWKVLGGLS